MNPNANVMTFRAADARSALSAVRAALGGEAVILETREVAGGLFGKAQIEVTAAGPVAGAPESRRAAFEDTPAPARAPRHVSQGMSSGMSPGMSSGDLQGEVAALRRVVEEMHRRMPAEASGSGPGSRGGGSGSDSLGLGLGLASRYQRDQRGQDDLTGGRDDAPRYTGELLTTYKHLVRRGMEPFLAQALIDETQRRGVGTRPGAIEEAAKAAIGKQMVAAPAPWLAEGRRSVALIGPTGVGKTTAIAKIAARALLETRFKVALITVDTYRVGASDQLARYGKIMGIETHVARDQAGLAEAVNRFEDADLILIDTAGRSDSASLAAQTSLLRTVPNVQLQLVLSAATGGRELGAVARRYRAIAPERLIFTKLDEVDGPGSIYSAVAALPRPISCITDGQRVPEDIHPVTGPDLVGIIFGS